MLRNGLAADVWSFIASVPNDLPAPPASWKCVFIPVYGAPARLRMLGRQAIHTPALAWLCRAVEVDPEARLACGAMAATVEAVNTAHDLAGLPDTPTNRDIKFRALTCAALNAGALHAWFAALTVHAHGGGADAYSLHAYMRTPVAHQVC